jgi:hypothetical protein
LRAASERRLRPRRKKGKPAEAVPGRSIPSWRRKGAMRIENAPFHKIKAKSWFFLILLSFAIPIFPKSKWYPYCSPGFKIAWDFNYGFSTTFKVSIGMHNDDDFIFANITPGITVNKRSRYFFAELESGYPIYNGLFLGGGFGVAFYTSDFINMRFAVIPKGSLFAGALLLWLRDDFIVINKNRFQNDVGVIATFPITKFKLELPGGI